MKKENQKEFKIGAGICILIAIVVCLFLLLRGKETYVSEEKESQSIASLVCTTSETDDAFFASDTAKNVLHEIKITLSGDMPSKATYNFTGTYESDTAAEVANSRLHADYNIYMGQEAENYYPTFSFIDNTLKINLYVEKNQMDTKIGKIFYLKADEVTGFYKNTGGKLKKLYEEKGFSCNLNNLERN